MKIFKPALAFTLTASMAALAQTNSAPANSSSSAPAVATPSATDKAAANRSAAYYHYTLAHMYEELVSIYQSTEFANKAIDEYRLAIASDPTSEYLNSGLAELYAKTGRIRDAVNEAEEIIKRDPNNLEARKLLGRIYLRGLGDMQSGTQSQEVLKRAIEQYEQIARLEKDSAEDHILLGRLYRLNNELLKAETEFKAAVSLQPGSEEAVTMLAYLYNEEGDATRATQVLSSVPEPDRSAKIYSALGYTYEQQKDYAKAVDAYRKAVEQDKDNLDAARGLAQNLINSNQTSAALDQYKSIIEADPHDAQSYMRVAEIYRRQGKFDQALEFLKKAQTEVPDSLEVPYNIAVIYQAQGKYDEAAQMISGLLKKNEKPDGKYPVSERNNRAVFLERLGTLYRDQNKTSESVAAFRRMIELGDDNAERAYQQIIDTYRDAKQWNEATAIAKEAVGKLPNNRNLKMVYASQLADTGQADVALAQVKGLLKGTPEDREVYIALGQMYSRLRRYPESEQALMKASELSTKPDDKDYVDFILGSVYEREKKYEPAEEVFRRILQHDPANASALNYLGYMMADRSSHLEEALSYVKKAIDLEPENGAYLDSLGWVYFKMGRYEMAEENLRKAVDKVNDPTILDHLGDLFLKTDRVKLAAEFWQRALQEFSKTVSAEVDQTEVAKVQKKLDAARIKLAREGSAAPVK